MPNLGAIISAFRRPKRSIGPNKTAILINKSASHTSRLNENVVEDDSDDDVVTLRDKIHATVTRPRYSLLAFYISLWDLLMILVATSTLIMETTPDLREKSVWFVFEAFVVINFSLLFFVKLFSCPSVYSFWLDFMNIVDFAAIVPFYIEIVIALIHDTCIYKCKENSSVNIGGIAVVRVLRLARIFRLFKFSRFSSGFSLVVKAVKLSMDGFYLLMFLLGLLVVFFSSLLYYVEASGCDLRGNIWVYNESTNYSGKISPFQSIPSTFWWAMVTITTVGYGDTVPNTSWGRALAAVAMLTAMVVVAFPITILGSNFADVYEQDRIEKKRAYSDSLNGQLTSVICDKEVTLNDEQVLNLFCILNQLHEQTQENLKIMEASVTSMRKQYNDINLVIKAFNSHFERTVPNMEDRKKDQGRQSVDLIRQLSRSITLTSMQPRNETPDATEHPKIFDRITAEQI